MTGDRVCVFNRRRMKTPGESEKISSPLPTRISLALRKRFLLLAAGTAFFALAIVSILSIRGADFNGDLLPDDWEAAHGFSTNGLPNTNLPPSVLVGWWQFDDASQTNVLDRSGNSLTGSLINFPSFPFVPGVFSNALSFTTNSYVSFEGTNAFLCLTNSFTISLWFSGSNAVEETTLIEWTSANSNTWELSVTTNGAAQLRFSDASLNVQIVSGGTNAVNVRDSLWHHLAGVYDFSSSNSTVYVDGRAEATEVITNWDPFCADTFGFGIISIPPPNAPFLLDEARLYN